MASRLGQSILKEINSILIGSTALKLKRQYFGHLMQRADSLEKTLMLGGFGGSRRRGRQRMRWLDGITDSMVFEQTQGGNEGQGGLACCSPRGLTYPPEKDTATHASTSRL